MWGIVSGDFPILGLTVLWLVFLEGLLSADNALVLAIMVRHLPKDSQKRALRYGIWGAFIFRIIAVFLAGYLLHFWFLKVAGGLYLLYLAVQHFLSSKHDDADAPARTGKSFWRTVVAVELADIAFSIDSILAAVALAEGLPPSIDQNWKYGVVILGGVLGIITMRFVAGYFILLLERYRGLEAGAYGLVAWIGIKLVMSGFHKAGYIPLEMAEWVFWPGMIVIILIAFVYQPRSKTKSEEPKKGGMEEIDRVVRGEDVETANVEPENPVRHSD